ncbi:MAG: hypothetical protein GDA52_00660, partial [Rhodobacteraceae bacterium]|nr:hypothetical protein [Paracoccaceae bacterium]
AENVDVTWTTRDSLVLEGVSQNELTITGNDEGDSIITWTTDGTENSRVLEGVAQDALTITDNAEGAAVITWNTKDSITLEGVASATLTAEDFIFAGDADDKAGARGKINELDGTDASDTLTGSSGRDSVDGGAGNDRLIGRADNDVINGGVGRDTLAGNRGDDTLDGGRYSDTLIGGHGDDVLTGGKWKDTFAFDTGHGDDVITDFEDGMDLIQITASDVGFDDLAIADEGGDATITWAGGSITLEGVDHTALTAEDFVF